MTKDEALNLAIEVLQKNIWCDDDCNCSDRQAITAIKEALAQPEHGWTPERIAGMARLKDAQDKKLAQRTWVGLTDAEVKKIVGSDRYTDLLLEVVNFVEAKLKEKNT